MQPLVGVLQKQLDSMEGALTARYARCIFDPQRPQGQDNLYRPDMRPMTPQSLLVQPITTNSLLFQVCFCPPQISNFKNLHDVAHGVIELSCISHASANVTKQLEKGW